jgi:hypothetical protein
LPVAFLVKWSLKTFATSSDVRVYTLVTEFRPESLPSFEEHVGYFNELIHLVAATHRVAGICLFAEAELGTIITSCEKCAKLIRDELETQISRSPNDRERWINEAKRGILKLFWTDSSNLDAKATDYYDHYYPGNVVFCHQERAFAMPIHRAGARLCREEGAGQSPMLPVMPKGTTGTGGKHDRTLDALTQLRED